MLEILANNWVAILLIAVVVAFVTAIIVLSVKGKKQIVFKMLYALVDEAEKLFTGSGTGKLKFSYVIEKVYAKLPTVFRYFITYKTLEKWIEKALVEMKEFWAEQAEKAEQEEQAQIEQEKTDN